MMWLLKPLKAEKQLRCSNPTLNKTQQTEEEAAEQYALAESSRILAFFGVALATVSAVTTVLVVPMLYGYAQRTHSMLEPEIEYCMDQSRMLWNQLDQVI